MTVGDGTDFAHVSFFSFFFIDCIASRLLAFDRRAFKALRRSDTVGARGCSSEIWLGTSGVTKRRWCERTTFFEPP